MKILMVGGAGYIGSVLAPKLQERGYEVKVIDALWFGNHLDSSMSILKKDVFAVSRSDLEGYDDVIFLAGLSNDPMAEYSPSMNFVYNAAAPAYLGYQAKRAGVKRFIFASSCSVYGYTEGELYTETQRAGSNYPYGIAKLQGEQALMGMADDRFSVLSLRKGTVCGFSPRMRLDLIVNTMFKTSVQKNEIVINNPAIWRPILSIQDAASAYIRAVEAHPSISGIFNIASGNYTVGEVGDHVKEVMEEHLDLKIRLKILNQEDYRNYKVSIDKAVKVLGFKPNHNIREIVLDLIANRQRFSDLDNPQYYNIEVFRSLRLDAEDPVTKRKGCVQA